MDITELIPPSTANPVDKIIPALIAATKGFTPVVTNASAQITDSRRYKYATLAQVLSSITGPLGDNGLLVISEPKQEGLLLSMTTTIWHTSGQSISKTLKCKIRDESPQTIGSGMTYLRRYLILAMLNLAPEEDDDGAAAQPAPRGEGQQTQQGRPVRRVVRGEPARPEETGGSAPVEPPAPPVDPEYEKSKTALRTFLVEVCGKPDPGVTWTPERIEQRKKDMDRIVFYVTGATDKRMQSAKEASLPENVQHVLMCIHGVLAGQDDPHDYQRFLEDARAYCGA